MESKASRSARVKLQLRDSKGRWVQMFSKVKWNDPTTKKDLTGIVSGFKGNNALVDLHDRHGKNLGKNVSVDASTIEVINEKAEIEFDENGKVIGSKPADSAGPQDAVDDPNDANTLPTDALMDYIALGHNETTYKIGSEGNKPMFTPTSSLKVGDQLYPVAKVGKFQKSPYNSSGNPAQTLIQKYDKGIGTVTKIKEGEYVVISDPNGKTYAVSWKHHALKRSNELDQAILTAQSMEANSIYEGKEAPKLPWIDALKDELNPAVPNEPKAVIPEQAPEAPENAPEAVDAPEAPAADAEPTVPVFDAKKYTLENDSQMSKEIADRLPVGTVLQGVKEDGLVSKNLLEKISDTEWNMWSNGNLVKAVKTDNFKNYLSNFPFNKWSPNEPVAPKDNSPKVGDIVNGEQIANLPAGSKVVALGNEYTLHEKGYWTNPKTSGGMKSSVFKTTPNVKLTAIGGSDAAPEEAAPETPAAENKGDYKWKDSPTKASEIPVGSKLINPSNGWFAEKTADNKWITSANVEYSDSTIDSHKKYSYRMQEPETGAPVAEEVNPFGENYVKKAHPHWNLKKGDVTLFKDGRTGDYIGIGNIKTAEGMSIKAQKFNIDGKEEIVEGKDISASFSPKSLIVHTTGENPFGEGYQPFSFDLSKPNNDNFKAGDKIIYGKDKNQGTILSVNPTNILVQKDNSDKAVKGTPTVTASQIHGKYSKVEQPAVAPAAEAPLDDKYKVELDPNQHVGPKYAEKLAEQRAATPGKYADKGKSVQNEQGETMKVNDVVFTPKYGKGTVAIVLPSTDPTKLGSAKVFYDSENGFKVTQAKNLSLFDADKIAETAPKTTSDQLAPGETGMNPETGKMFIAGKDGQPIHKGDKISYTKGGQTAEGTVKGIYAGEKTVAITWDNGTTTGPKKASTLTALSGPSAAPEKADQPTTDAAPEAAPEAAPDVAPEAPAAAAPYSPEQEKALHSYNENYKEIGEHLRGIAAHAFAGAEEIIEGIDSILKESTLDAPIKTYRGFKTSDAKILDGFKVGTIFRDKAFISTSLDESVAAQSMMGMEGDHSVLIDFELPAGYHAAKVNYDGFSEGSYMKDLADEQEVLLPRLVDFQVVSVEETTDVNGNKVLKAHVKGIVKSAADSLMGNGIHQVASKTPGDKNPFKILDDPGADGDGFHKTGPWGHFGASGVLVSAKDPETGETKYLIVENGELHEKQNQGLWQLPGGALNGNENPYQGAAREMWEELDVDPAAMEAMEHVGDIEYSNGKGWAYTNIAAKSETMFPVKIDVIETSDYKWASKAELKQMMDDKMLLPAFAQNIDKLLGVYGEDHDQPAAVPEATPDAVPDTVPEIPADEPAAVKNIANFTKTNKGQAGSNQGGFYTDNATGEMYYIKNGMKEDHARNEILASKIYNALGVNASVQEEIDLGDGKIGIASKIIQTDGHNYNVNLEDEAYLKKVQEDFAIDALLANWDVAGMGYDNILTDAQGNPLRIDPGASLRYRAQGAAKSDFGKTVGEWDYLRTGQNNESSAIKYNKKLFGSMTNQQLVDSANKLNELTDEKLDSIVDSVGFDEIDTQYFKETLKARREDILQRAAKLVDPTTKDDNDTAAPATGTQEAVPEESGQVQLDGQPADPDGAPDAGSAGPAVGAFLLTKELHDLPVGAVVLDVDAKTTLTKSGPTTWQGVLSSGVDLPPIETQDIIEVISDGDLQLVSLRPINTNAPAVGADLTIKEVNNLPVGSKVMLQDQQFTKKSEDNTWVTDSGNVYTDKNMNEIFEDGELSLAETGDGTYKGEVTLSFDEFVNLPAGSVAKATNGATQYEKVDDLSWKSLQTDTVYQNSAFEGSEMVLISEGTGNASSESGFKTFAPGDSVTDQMDLLAVGSAVKVKGGSTTYTKSGEGEWTSQYGGVFNEHEDFEGTEMELISAPEATDVTAYEPGDKLKSGDYSKFPVGTVVKSFAGWNYTKKADNFWENENEASYEDDQLDEASMTYVSGPAESTTPEVTAPTAAQTTWDTSSPTAFNMPIGTVLNNPTSPYAAKKLTKVGPSDWVSDTGAKHTDPVVDSVKTDAGWSYEPLPAPKAGSTVAPSDLPALPNGTVIENGTAEFTKIAPDAWKSSKSGATFKDVWFGDDNQNFAVTVVSIPDEDSAPATHDASKINDLPVGSKIETADGNAFTKDSPSYWTANGVGGWSIDNVLKTNNGQGTVKVLEVGQAAEEAATPEAPAFKVGDKVNVWTDIPKFEIGTEIGSGHFSFKKISDTQWKQGNSAATVVSHNLVTIFNDMDVSVIALPGETPAAPEVPKNGSILTPGDIKALPAGSKFHDNLNNDWVKLDDKWYKNDASGAKVTDHYFTGFGQAIPDVFTMGSKDGGPADAIGFKVGQSVMNTDVQDFPVGTEFHDEDGISYTKDGPGSYIDTDGNTYTSYQFTLFDQEIGITKVGNGGQTTDDLAPSTPSVPGKDGKPLSVGDYIEWTTKGTPGTVVGINIESSKVHMLLADGTKKWYASSKMIKKPIVASPYVPPVKKAKLSGDPESPLFGQPKPVFSGPEGLTNPGSYAPEGFEEEIAERYAAKLNPSWSKTDPKLSFYWSEVEKFKSTGDINALEKLHEKLYISDEMLAKAKAKQTDFAATKKAYDAEYKKAVAAFGQQVSDWKAANGAGVASFEDHFPEAASADEEWTPENGYVTMPDGSISADWSKAPTGSHSVASIIDSMAGDEDLSAHGMSAMVDSDWIRDNTVRFTKVVDDDGVTRLQAKFEVSEAKKKDVGASMSDGHTTYGVKGGFVGYVKSAFSRFSKFNKSGHGLVGELSGKTYTKKVGNADLMFQMATAKGWTNNTSTQAASAFITLPENATAQDFENALKAMGVTNANPSSKQAVDFSKAKQLVSTFRGWVGEGNTQYEQDPALLDTHVAETLAELGGNYTLDDFQLVPTEMGFYAFKTPKDLMQKLTDESGLTGLLHGNYDWVPEGKHKNSYSLYSWNAGDGLDRFLNKFAGAAKGYLSTGRRMLEGDDSKGMSPIDDVNVGSARYLFTTPFKKNMNGETNGYNSGTVAHPSMAFRYLGNYANHEDNGEGKRKEGNKLVDVINGYWGSSPEVMILNGISIKDTWYSWVPQEQKKELMKQLREKGVEEVNGIPIEQFFVVPGVDPLPVWVDPDDR